MTEGATSPGLGLTNWKEALGLKREGGEISGRGVGFLFFCLYGSVEGVARNISRG